MRISAVLNTAGSCGRIPPRARLLRHWTSPRHPHHARFAAHRELVEKVLSPGVDDIALDASLREQGQSLRAAVREIPPVFGTI